MADDFCLVEHHVYGFDVVCRTCQKMLMEGVDGILGLTRDELFKAQERVVTDHLEAYEEPHDVSIRDTGRVASFQVTLPIFLLPASIQAAVHEHTEQ